uniref:Ig-like domain-containing protein n=1 Tax=Elaeophora elaphi TaxID=1147741 RepID=A0A0R3RFI7_9BILA
MTKTDQINAARHWWTTNGSKSQNLDVGLASPSISHHSLEFDDLFELYSEEDNRGHGNGKMKKRSNLYNSLKVSSRTDIKENFPNDASKLRRKDLEFGEFIQREESILSEDNHTQETVHEKDETRRAKISLLLEMKLKISDKQVSCSAHTRFIYVAIQVRPPLTECYPCSLQLQNFQHRIGEETVVVTCAGDYGDMESILKWTIDRKVEDGRELWVNDPIADTTSWDTKRLPMISDVSFRR